MDTLSFIAGLLGGAALVVALDDWFRSIIVPKAAMSDRKRFV